MDALGISLSYPLIQAPMAGVQDERLAAAVSNAGGLGSLPAAMLSCDQLDTRLKRFRELSNGPLNVNFFCHQTPDSNECFSSAWMGALRPYFEELGVDHEKIAAGAERRPFNNEACEVLEANPPEVVSFHFGLPDTDLLQRVKKLGTKVISTATTIAEAVWLQNHGADGIIAQGLEAGGHRGHFLQQSLVGQLTLSELLPALIEAVDIPVIAAGGIVRAGTVQECLQEGASAVQVGTAFLLCDEATTSKVHRQALVKTEMETAITNVFSGRPARGIVNRAIRELGPMSEIAPPFPQAAVAITALRQKAESMASGDFSPLWSGEHREGCDAVAAEEIVRRLMAF